MKTVEGRGALQALDVFMADMQAGVGPFLGIFLSAHGWRTGAIGTVMTLCGALSAPKRSRARRRPLALWLTFAPILTPACANRRAGEAPGELMAARA